MFVPGLRIGLLASRDGSNAQAVIDACAAGTIGRSDVVRVASNNSASGALARGRGAGIATVHLSGTTHPDPEALDRAICAAMQSNGVDLVVLAGYMKKLGAHTLRAFAGRIINVHPALLPKFGGPGMYGRRVHDAVLAARETITGATVHLVDGEYDQGRILTQRETAVLPDDSAESLAARVLVIEHELLVAVLADVACGAIGLPLAPG